MGPFLRFIVLIFPFLKDIFDSDPPRPPRCNNSTNCDPDDPNNPNNPIKYKCVSTDRELRRVIAKASNKNRETIALCKEIIKISDKINEDNITGIDLTDRLIDLSCKFDPNVATCILDGQGSSQIFFGQNTDLTMTNINVINANGGAISLGSSNATFTGCSFMNNNGIALNVDSSTLTINGGSIDRPVMLSDNIGNDVVFASNSDVSIDGYTVFSNNFESEGTLYLDGSNVTIRNAKFQKNSGGGALLVNDCQMTMTNVEFIENNGQFNVALFTETSLQATSCTFSNHKITVLEVEDSKITLNNSTFSNNTYIGNGSIIKIIDDNDPLTSGTFVKCESMTVFCNGIDNNSIYEEFSVIDKFSNTDCKAEGVNGTPGQGSCPI